MRNIKITLAYDGTAYHGWQNQPGLPTIQGAVAEVLRKITQEKMQLQGASRTDAGVHALGQVAHFHTRSAFGALEFQRALNALLPPAIRVVAAEERGPDFHARFQAQGKTYQYRIFRGRVLPPFELNRALHYPWPLDEGAMMEAARLFEGEHDFTSFAASSGSEDDDRDRVMTRMIYRSELVRREYAPAGSEDWGPEVAASQRGYLVGSGPDDDGAAWELRYIVRGKSFLRYMVRKIVGTLLDVGKGRLTPEDIPRILEMRDRSRSGMTVPPEGLYLVALEYPDPTASLERNFSAATDSSTRARS